MRINMIYDAESAERLQNTLDDVLEKGHPRVQRGRYPRPAGELVKWEAVFLPVRADERTMVFCHTVNLDA